jgi:RNA polymerase sigma-70 factor (sigma-E family)
VDRDEEFSAYVGERRAQLYRTAVLLCGDPHRAEDVVQTALAKLYAAWPRVRRADSVDAYARRAVVNVHLDETRRPWRRERSTSAADLDGRAPAGLPVEEVDALWSALRALPAGQRRVVVLRHYWGLSVEETAADLGVSTGTVKSQTSDALARLRSTLALVENPGEHR